MIRKLLHRIISIPKVYDLFQSLVGPPAFLHRLIPLLADTGGQLVCEVGAGTGNLRAALPASARYLGIDNDPEKIGALVRKWPADFAVLGDGAALCLKDKSVDCLLCVDMSHHLTDEQLACLFPELARVTRRKLIFVDAIKHDRLVPKLLWRYDRGSNPRTQEELSAAIETAFHIERTVRFSRGYEFFICQATPKDAPALASEDCSDVSQVGEARGGAEVQQAPSQPDVSHEPVGLGLPGGGELNSGG